MASRLELQTLLETVLGSKNVYYQPPPSVQMSYPAIVYSRSRIKNDAANNAVYNQHHWYKVSVIDKNPDSSIVDRMSKLPTCAFDQHYATDNLNHDVFSIYF